MTSDWIFKEMIPQQKIAAFQRLAKFKVEQLGPNATADAIRAAKQAAWDSIDNRFGSMVYDNLHWNNVFKDLAMIMVRSTGWDFGTLRELGGGVKDYKNWAATLADGKKPAFTTRMAYTASMMATTALIGGMANYLMTGESPKEIADYFFPRTGERDQYNNPLRVNPPSYFKDFHNIWPLPGESMQMWGDRMGKVGIGKLNPVPGLVLDLIKNKKWDGSEIYDRNNDVMENLDDIARFVGDEVLPFSMKGLIEDWFRKKQGLPARQSKKQYFASAAGFTSVSTEFYKKKYERVERSLLPTYETRRTPEEAATYELKREAAKQLKMGNEKEFNRIVKDGVDRGLLAPEDRGKLIKANKVIPRIKMFHRLGLEDGLSTYFNFVRTDPDIPLDEKKLLLQSLRIKVAKGWAQMERRDKNDPIKRKCRNLLQQLNLMDQNGTILGIDTSRASDISEADEEDEVSDEE